MKMAAPVVSLLVAAMAVTGGAAGAQTATQDSVTGSGTFNERVPGARESLTVDARSGPSGEDPSGRVEATVGFSLGRITVTGDVTCLRVVGRTAVVSGRIPSPPNIFADFTAAIQDNAGTGQPDQASVQVRIPGSPTPTCDPFPGPFALLFPVLSGDFTVNDAPPLPRTRQQCQNGGWRNYGIFKSQGDCVSFVATKGKSQPSGP